MVCSHNINVPPLYLTTKYEDIQRVEYSQKFYLALSARYTINRATQDYALYYTFTRKKVFLWNLMVIHRINFQKQYDYPEVSSYNGFPEQL